MRSFHLDSSIERHYKLTASNRLFFIILLSTKLRTHNSSCNMSPRRPQRHRVNKHVRTLHCECGQSYTRADFYELHLQLSGHNSEFIAASEQMPEPASDAKHFYCSCGAGYTASHAFLAHCKRTGHLGDWKRSKYQPKGYISGSMTANIEVASASNELSTSFKHPVSAELSAQFPKSSHASPEMEPSSSEDSAIGISVNSEETGQHYEAHSQTRPLSEGRDDRRESGEEVGMEERHFVLKELTMAPPLGGDATPNRDDTSHMKTVMSSERDRIQDVKLSSIETTSPHRTQPLFAGPAVTQEASSTRPQVWHSRRQSRHSRTTLDLLRRTANAGVRKVSKSAAKFGSFTRKYKDELSATLLSAAIITAGVYCLQNQPMSQSAASGCSTGWRFDLDTPMHVAKQSEYFSNVDAIFKVDAQNAWGRNEFGTVPLTFKDGTTILLEKVLYNARADTNVVSKSQLEGAGLLVEFSARNSEFSIYSATNDGIAGRASKIDNVYCLHDLAPPPSATTYPSRLVPESISKASNPEIETVDVSKEGVLSSAVLDSRVSASSSPFDSTQLPGATPVTTTFPPFEPSNTASSISTNASTPSTLSVSTTKRKLEDYIDESDEASAKRNRTGKAVQKRIEHQLVELKASITVAAKSIWSHLPDRLGWPLREDLDNTPTPPHTPESVLPATTVQDASVETAKVAESGDVSMKSQRGLLRSLLGVDARVDAQEYDPVGRTETADKAADVQEEMDTPTRGVTDNVCPPCEPCKKCLVFE